MEVRCAVNYIELESNHGMIDSVSVTCSECGHETESYGTGAASVRRCLALLREECPREESNYYLADGAENER
jgi:hypothetical protein